MEIIGSVCVNSRGERAHLVAGDVIDPFTLDIAVKTLHDADVVPIVAQFYILDLPLVGWQNLLMMGHQRWISLSPGRVAVNEFKPIIATYKPALDREIIGGITTPKTGVGELRGDGGLVRLFFACG